MKEEKLKLDVQMPNSDGKVAYTIPVEVSARYDEDLGDYVLDGYAMEKIDRAKAYHMKEETKKQYTVYIAGPMRGIKYYNYHAFVNGGKKVREKLDKRGKGFIIEVINPHNLDFEQYAFNVLGLPETFDWDNLPYGMELKDIINRDIDAVSRSDAIYMLKGWENSTGASAEHAIAKWYGKDVYYE